MSGRSVVVMDVLLYTSVDFVSSAIDGFAMAIALHRYFHSSFYPYHRAVPN